MAKKPYTETKDGTPPLVAAAATGYQLGWSGGRWVVIRGNAGSQSQTQAESQALANQLNSFVGSAGKPRG